MLGYSPLPTSPSLGASILAPSALDPLFDKSNTSQGHHSNSLATAANVQRQQLHSYTAMINFTSQLVKCQRQQITSHETAERLRGHISCRLSGPHIFLLL